MIVIFEIYHIKQPNYIANQLKPSNENEEKRNAHTDTTLIDFFSILFSFARKPNNNNNNNNE